MLVCLTAGRIKRNTMILSNFYKGELFVLSFAILLVCECSEVPRPRGVSISRAPLYAPGKDFTCFDGSLTIPFDSVNDDYCDCNDGSDEPGTSACLNGMFHCTNAGHKPLNIPSSRVNDGICDCCDASDEYGKNPQKCVNNCGEMGREARLEALRKAELLKAGSQLRSEIIQKGSVMKQEMEEKIQELEKNKQEAELLKEEKQRIKDEAEALENEALKQYREVEEAERKVKEGEEATDNAEEAEEMFNKFDSDKNGILSIAEIQTRSTFDKDRNGEVSDEEARFFLAEQDEIALETFVERAWPLVKPYLMIEGGIFKPPAGQEHVDADLQEHEHQREERDIEEQEDGSGQHEGFADGEGEEDAEEDEVPEKDIVDEVASEDDHPEPPQYDNETQNLVNTATEARGKFAEADRVVRDIENEIHKIKESLDKDYGPQEEFATLAGTCLEYTDREYLYKLCPFDRASQQPKNGGSETRLGNWGEWVGEAPHRYSAMLYSQGTACWNGPNRSARINIHCGLETSINSVSEPNRCEYVFEMHTPAACVDDTSDNSQRSAHDEL